MATPKGKAISPAKSPVRMVKQPHGGALRQGGNTTPGTGRPPSIIRERLRGSFADRVKILETIADGKVIQRMTIDGKETRAEVSADVGDRIKAIDMLAKYGLGTLKEVSVENVRERVQDTLQVIRAQTSPEQATSIIAALRPIWA